MDQKTSGAKMKDHKLSNQAVGAIMMALQKSLMEQTDIVPVLRAFNVQIDDAEGAGHNEPSNCRD